MASENLPSKEAVHELVKLMDFIKKNPNLKHEKPLDAIIRDLEAAGINVSLIRQNSDQLCEVLETVDAIKRNSLE
ncbi:MAG: hypothetical protein K0S38_149 [Candidatus Paceibacter sp.]|jgi:hypothetical protein|nr:hypothetical protein [Candidatus Paceibacter sp.]